MNNVIKKIKDQIESGNILSLDTEQGMADLVVKYVRDGKLSNSEWNEINSVLAEQEEMDNRIKNRIVRG